MATRMNSADVNCSFVIRGFGFSAFMLSTQSYLPANLAPNTHQISPAQRAVAKDK
jgi:hypothetical protein